VIVLWGSYAHIVLLIPLSSIHFNLITEPGDGVNGCLIEFRGTYEEDSKICRYLAGKEGSGAKREIFFF
jgi:hypothetical protein